MSARVSSVPSASASASSAVGGARAAPATGASADGAAGCEGAGAGAGAGSGAGAGAGASFSSVIAHAAHGQDAGLGANDGAGDNTGGAKASGSNDATDAGCASAAQAAASVTAPDVAPATSQSLTQSQPSAAAQGGNARAGRPTARPGGGARAAGKDSASAVTTDPVALAMLLAASGMQMSAAADANGATDAAGSAPASVSGAPGSAIAATGDATGSADAAPSSQSAQSQQPGQSQLLQPQPPAPMARDIAAQLPDARTAADSIGGALSDPAALAAKSAAGAGQSDAVQIGSATAGLPELVRSFTITGPQGAVVETTIPVPVSSAGWPHALAAQVHWFVNNDVQSATLRLSPEHLGPVEVQIDVQKSQVNVNFSAASAETRTALEQTVPRLREIFASGGLTLGHTNVQADPRPGSQPTALPVRTALAHAQTVEPVAVAATQMLGLVDEYA